MGIGKCTGQYHGLDINDLKAHNIALRSYKQALDDISYAFRKALNDQYHTTNQALAEIDETLRKEGKMTMRFPEAMEFAIVGSKLYRKAWGTKTHIQMTKIET